jgi:hypothetical protein
MTDFRAAITEEPNAMEYDILCTEKAHFIAAEQLKKVHLWVGLLATASAGASTATYSRQLQHGYREPLHSLQHYLRAV